MDFKKLLNLNTYEWWRNHRRVITLGIFLALFAGYVRGPSANEFKVRDTCGRFEGNGLNKNETIRKLGLKKIKFKEYAEDDLDDWKNSRPSLGMIREYCNFFKE